MSCSVKDALSCSSVKANKALADLDDLRAFSKDATTRRLQIQAIGGLLAGLSVVQILERFAHLVEILLVPALLLFQILTRYCPAEFRSEAKQPKPEKKKQRA